jgi:hypothetical protein
MICAQVLDRMQAMIDCIEHAGGRYASGNGMSWLKLCVRATRNIEQFKSVDAPKCLNDVSRPAITNERNMTYPEKR